MILAAEPGRTVAGPPPPPPTHPDGGGPATGGEGSAS